MVECICLNAQSKPKEIPTDKWIKKDEKYHIIHVSVHTNQGNIQGVTLAEKDISNCTPYSAFRMDRFAIKLIDKDALIELMKNCTELNDIEIEQFINEKIGELV